MRVLGAFIVFTVGTITTCILAYYAIGDPGIVVGLMAGVAFYLLWVMGKDQQ